MVHYQLIKKRVRIGLLDGEGTLDRRNFRCVLEIRGIIKVEDSLIIGQGSRVCVGENAILEIDQMTNTSRLHLVCMNHIKIGKNVLIAWDTTIMDSDMHVIKDIKSGEIKLPTREIIIEDNVWIGTRSIILKGTCLPEGSIVGAGSVIAGKFHDSCSVICGNPARVVEVGLTRYRNTIIR